MQVQASITITDLLHDLAFVSTTGRPSSSFQKNVIKYPDKNEKTTNQRYDVSFIMENSETLWLSGVGCKNFLINNWSPKDKEEG